MFDLTAANIAGKYPGKAGLQMMLHMVFKVRSLYIYMLFNQREVGIREDAAGRFPFLEVWRGPLGSKNRTRPISSQYGPNKLVQ